MVRSEHALHLSDAMLAHAAKNGEVYGVDGSISEKDQLLGYFINKARMEPIEAISAYFSGGKSDARAVSAVMAELMGPELAGRRVLEFASGFGRITRHLIKMHPEIHLTASDIHEDACIAMTTGCGVDALPSASTPDELKLPNDQDFIFVMSFFSHLPDAVFGRWLAALYNLLRPGGQMLFTTHGESLLDRDPAFFRVGFDANKGHGFRPESDQDDLSSENYVTAVVTDVYVRQQIAAYAPNAEVRRHRQRAWFGIQDEWVIRKP